WGRRTSPLTSSATPATRDEIRPRLERGPEVGLAGARLREGVWVAGAKRSVPREGWAGPKLSGAGARRLCPGHPAVTQDKSAGVEDRQGFPAAPPNRSAPCRRRSRG